MLRRIAAACLRLHGAPHTRPPQHRTLCSLISPDQTERSRGVDQSEDILLRQLRSAGTASHLISLVDAHHGVMNLRHVQEFMATLFLVRKGGREDGWRVGKGNVVNESEGFRRVCALLQKKARFMEPGEVLNALKALLFWKVDSNSTVVQTLLQLLRHRINSLSIQEVEYLHFILTKVASPSPLRDALLMALPVVFEAQLGSQLADISPQMLPQLLRFATTNCPDTVPKIMEAMTRSSGQMGPEQAHACLWSFLGRRAVMPESKYSEALLSECLEVMLKALPQLTSSQTVSLLSAMCNKISFGSAQFYREPLFDLAGDMAMSSQWDLGLTSRLLRSLTRCGHVHMRLADRVASDILNFQAKEGDRDSVSWALCSLVSACSLAVHKTPDWGRIVELIIGWPHWIAGDSQLPLIRFALDLLSLDVIAPDLLAYITSPDYLRSTFGTGMKKLHYFQLLRIHQALETIYKETYSGPRLPEDIILTALKLHGEDVQDFQLEGALLVGLGGANYFKTSMFTRLGHHIDHLVLMRKGGYPVAINQVTSPNTHHEREYAEDLQLPADSILVPVKQFKPNGYPLNSNVPKGMLCLELRTLEAMGFFPFAISQTVWEDTPEHERVPYLMAKLRERCLQAEQQQQQQSSDSISRADTSLFPS